MDIDTREWADGVLTDAARKVVREPSDVSCWIICDGDVDPEVCTALLRILHWHFSGLHELCPCRLDS
jgi:dynein heavy chain 2, cytosolic